MSLPMSSGLKPEGDTSMCISDVPLHTPVSLAVPVSAPLSLGFGIDESPLSAGYNMDSLRQDIYLYMPRALHYQTMENIIQVLYERVQICTTSDARKEKTTSTDISTQALIKTLICELSNLYDRYIAKIGELQEKVFKYDFSLSHTCNIVKDVNDFCNETKKLFLMPLGLVFNMTIDCSNTIKAISVSMRANGNTGNENNTIDRVHIQNVYINLNALRHSHDYVYNCTSCLIAIGYINITDRDLPLKRASNTRETLENLLSMCHSVNAVLNEFTSIIHIDLGNVMKYLYINRLLQLGETQENALSLMKNIIKSNPSSTNRLKTWSKTHISLHRIRAVVLKKHTTEKANKEHNYAKAS